MKAKRVGTTMQMTLSLEEAEELHCLLGGDNSVNGMQPEIHTFNDIKHSRIRRTVRVQIRLKVMLRNAFNAVRIKA